MITKAVRFEGNESGREIVEWVGEEEALPIRNSAGDIRTIIVGHENIYHGDAVALDDGGQRDEFVVIRVVKTGVVPEI